MEWTSTPPTEPGWYWRRLRRAFEAPGFCEEMVVKVVLRKRGGLVVMGGSSPEFYERAEWAGPIPGPRAGKAGA